jgi:hypothetical protein
VLLLLLLVVVLVLLVLQRCGVMPIGRLMHRRPR